MTDEIHRPWAERVEQTRIPLDSDANQSEIATKLGEYIADEYDLANDTFDNHDLLAVAPDAPVIVKAARWRVNNGVGVNGQKHAHGRFLITKDEHEYLTTHNGFYVFVVYEGHTNAIMPLYTRVVYTEHLDAVIAGTAWDGQPSVRVAWPDIFPGTGAEL